MGSTAPPVACYLAEWYRPAVTQQPLDDTVAKLDAVAAAMCVEGSPVKLLVTLAVPTDEVIYGVFAACSPDIVIQACRRAGIPLERLSSDVAARITRVARDEGVRLATSLGKSPIPY
ncbi:MAG: hypothetical protein ACRDU4_22480 [Mycobacterium sp.]